MICATAHLFFGLGAAVLGDMMFDLFYVFLSEWFLPTDGHDAHF